MASVVAQALSSLPSYQSEGLHDTGVGSFQYQPAKIELQQSGPSTAHQIFDQIIGTGSNLMTLEDKHLQDTAEGDYQAQKARLAQGQITQDDFNKWVSDGSMFWKDNPYAQKAAKHDIGQQARIEADSFILQNKDKYKSLNEMHQALQERRQATLKNYSDIYNIPETDEDVLKGVGNGLVDSDIHLSEQWNAWKSDQDKNVATMGAYSNVNNLIQDPNDYNNPALKAQKIQTSLQYYMDNGVITDVSGQQKFLSDAITTLGSQPNGAAVIEALRKAPVKLIGSDQPVTFESVVGTDHFQRSSDTAATATINQNSQAYRDMSDESAQIDAEQDPVKKEALYQTWSKKWDSTIHPLGDKSPVTSLTQMDQRLRDSIQDSRVKANKAAEEVKVKAQKDFNGQTQATTYIQGDGPIIPDNWEWNTDAQGEKRQAYTNGMNAEVQRINTQFANDPDRRNAELMKLAGRDRGGFMQNYVNSEITSVKGEQDEIIHEGANADVSTKTHTAQQVAMYRANPTLYRQMMNQTKDGQEMEQDIELLASGKFDMKQLAESRQVMNSWDDATKKKVDMDWQNQVNAPGSVMMGIPSSVQTTARQVYNLTYAKTGSTQAAINAAQNYTEKQTIDFDDSDPDKQTGVASLNKISKSALNLDGNEANIPRVQTMVTNLMIEKNGSVHNSVISEDANGGIRIVNVQTGKSTYWTRDSLRKEFETRFKQQVQTQAQTRDAAVTKLGDEHPTIPGIGTEQARSGILSSLNQRPVTTR